NSYAIRKLAKKHASSLTEPCSLIQLHLAVKISLHPGTSHPAESFLQNLPPVCEDALQLSPDKKQAGDFPDEAQRHRIMDHIPDQHPALDFLKRVTVMP